MKTALILLDLQNEMVDPKGKVGSGGLARVVEERSVLRRAGDALGRFRAAGLPVAHVRLGFRSDYSDALSVAPRVVKMKERGACVLGTWGTEFFPAVAPRDDELVVTKQCVNPFFNTGLMNWLMRRGIERIAIGGVVTNLVVEATARAADDAGFAVVVLEDLCAATNAEWHRFSIENLLPLFGTVTTSTAFADDLTTPSAH